MRIGRWTGRRAGSLVYHWIAREWAWAQGSAWKVGWMRSVDSCISWCQWLFTTLSVLDTTLGVGTVVRLTLWVLYLLSRVVSVVP